VEIVSKENDMRRAADAHGLPNFDKEALAAPEEEYSLEDTIENGLDAADALDRLTDFLVEDILAASDEDIAEEAADEDEGVARLAAEMKNLIPARAFELYRQHASRSGDNVIPFPAQPAPAQPAQEQACEASSAAQERRFSPPSRHAVAAVLAAGVAAMALWYACAVSPTLAGPAREPFFFMSLNCPWAPGLSPSGRFERTPTLEMHRQCQR
jgi:hypothetical protein